MIQLIAPCEEYLASYMEAYDEYTANNVTDYSFTNAREVDIFDKVERYRKAENIPANHVGEDFYWLVDDASKLFIGQITIRHRLTEVLCLRGGHIGYGVRYTMWNKGYGSLMLKLALEKAKARGLERVLITCDDDNPASARVMEHNGFVLDDKVEVDGVLIRRYWKTL